MNLEDGTDRVTEMSAIIYERCMTSQKAGMSTCKNISAIIITVFGSHIVIISPLSIPVHNLMRIGPRIILIFE